MAGCSPKRFNVATREYIQTPSLAYYDDEGVEDRMRVLLGVLMAMSAAAPDAMAQTPGACSVLTKDLVVAHSPASKPSLNLMMKIPPEEEKAGGGTACQNGDVMLQINPFPVANFDKLFTGWTPVAGVGDKAVFRDNRGMWAELAVISGGRMITIQMDVPDGKKAADIQPNTISLAKAVLAKLK
jgi:hypothetical protein